MTRGIFDPFRIIINVVDSLPNYDPKLMPARKLVCTGGRTETDVCKAVNNLHATLETKGLMIYA